MFLMVLSTSANKIWKQRRAVYTNQQSFFFEIVQKVLTAIVTTKRSFGVGSSEIGFGKWVP